MIRMLNIDCMEWMKGLPDKAYELAIVDPPYGIGNWIQDTGNLRRNGEVVTWNEEQNRPDNNYFKELIRVSIERIIWGANYYNCFNGEMGAIIWNKLNPNPKFSSAEIAAYSRHKRVAMVDIPYYGFVGEEKNFHPCAKPVALYKWLLRNYAKPGDKILDTHGGSGSIAIACYDLGFDLDWMELDKDYYQAAVSRYESHVARYAPASEIPVTKKGEIKLF